MNFISIKNMKWQFGKSCKPFYVQVGESPSTRLLKLNRLNWLNSNLSNWLVAKSQSAQLARTSRLIVEWPLTMPPSNQHRGQHSKLVNHVMVAMAADRRLPLRKSSMHIMVALFTNVQKMKNCSKDTSRLFCRTAKRHACQGGTELPLSESVEEIRRPFVRG